MSRYGRDLLQTGKAYAAATFLTNDVLGVRSGELVLVSSDPGGDAELSYLIAEVVREQGAEAVQVVFPPVPHPGYPIHTRLSEFACGVDVWIELNKNYIEGTVAHLNAEAAGLRRFFSLTGMNTEDLITFVGDVDVSGTIAFGERLAELSSGHTELRVTCPNGSCFSASIEGCVAEIDTELMPLGQTHLYPNEESLAGTLVFNGSAFPPALGVLHETISVEFDHGRARIVSAGRESEILAGWMASLENPDIYRMCHLSYGYHPNALFPTGSLVNDERVFGCLCIGFGPPMPYACHTDLTILEPSVTIDDVEIQLDGRYLDPVLNGLAGELGVLDYPSAGLT